MERFDHVNLYKEWAKKNVKSEGDVSVGLKKAIGGEFEAFGLMERDLLIQHGLNEDSYIIDVGCGSGRLTKPLSEFLKSGSYLGIDIVPDFIRHAESLVSHPNFKFQVTTGFGIPEESEKADMICFFSVFTHLLHEETYHYLQDAKRVIKKNGMIVFSFLEFLVPPHWTVFQHDVDTINEKKHLNMFIGRDGIKAWAEHLGLEIVNIFRGDEMYIELSNDIVTDDGKAWSGKASLGQSVCVMRKI